ncbi:50S ribosome-binding protein YggL, partial [Shigella sonnei]|nr:50S ribosome-binding protein YggL [Shigella sonnei]
MAWEGLITAAVKGQFVRFDNLVNKTVDDFINEVIEPNKLAFDGSGYLAWEGLITAAVKGQFVRFDNLV